MLIDSHCAIFFSDLYHFLMVKKVLKEKISNEKETDQIDAFFMVTGPIPVTFLIALMPY